MRDRRIVPSLSKCATRIARRTSRMCVRAHALLAVAAVANAQTPTPTMTPMPTTACIGDCDGNDIVRVNEVLLLVSITLGRSEPTECSAGRGDVEEQIAIDDLVTAVTKLLHGCAPRTPTPTQGPFAFGRCSETANCDPCDVYPCRPSGASAELCCRLRGGSGTFSWCEVVDAAGFCVQCGNPCSQ